MGREKVRCYSCGRAAELDVRDVTIEECEKLWEKGVAVRHYRGGWVEHVIHEDVGCAPSYFCPDCAAEDYTLAEFGALAGLFEKSGE